MTNRLYLPSGSFLDLDDVESIRMIAHEWVSVKSVKGRETVYGEPSASVILKHYNANPIGRVAAPEGEGMRPVYAGHHRWPLWSLTVCAGDAIDIEVLRQLDGTHTVFVTHNGLLVSEVPRCTIDDAQRIAFGAAKVAIAQAEGVVLTWR